jgi:hypothetical protein
MADHKPAGTVRVPLVESYDRTYGFITDGVVDRTPERISFLPRPSIGKTVDLGTVAPSGMPAFTGGVFIDDQRVFALPTQTSLYMAILYHAVTGSANQYAVAIWSLTSNTLLGSTYLGAVTTANVSANGATLADSPGLLQVAATLAIANGGAAYANGDDITLAGGTYGDVALKINVDNQTAGVIDAASFINRLSAVYSVVPSNPVAQASTTGGGSGATFNITWETAFGFVVTLSALTGITNYWVGLTIAGATYVSTQMSGASRPANAISSAPVGPATLDGYNFYLETKGYLWNCNPGDPFTVDGLSFTQAFTTFSVPATGIAVHSNFLVVMGGEETRFFTVTGAFPGSAAAPILQAKFGFGPSSPELVTNVNETLCFCGSPDDGGVPVYMIPANSQAPRRVSYPYLERVLKGYTLTTARMLTWGGHFYFCVNTTTAVSFLYDLTTENWYQWTPFLASNAYALANATVFDNTTYIAANDTSSGHFFVMEMGAPGADTPYTGSSTYTPTLTTRVLDFEVTAQKQCKAVTLVGDQTASALPATLSYSDDTGQTWSIPRSIDLNTPNPVTRNLGQFRRRRFRVTLTPDPSVREDALQVDFAVGLM